MDNRERSINIQVIVCFYYFCGRVKNVVMSISIYIAPITNGVELVKKLLTDEFNIIEQTAAKLADAKIKPHFQKLKDSCYILAETAYVDKVYRDSYYHYYSSKLGRYRRDCIRLSIFEGEINDSDFRKAESIDDLQSRYRGFIVLRPIEPFIVGRGVISPRALKQNTFLCCSTKIQTTVNGAKFFIEGFPHSSQDTETISCAETTLWAIMEYFGYKYPEYKPVLPSRIITTLNKVTSERQLPSKGLNIQQMSFALKEFGFGTRIYAKQDYKGDFEKLISTYVESGVPIILGIDNRPSGNIGHAMLCIGHEEITGDQIDNISANQITNQKLLEAINKKGLKIYDFDGINKEFVFVDDNFPVYQKAKLDKLTVHYPADWHNCLIKHFIVPLYPKIYLEAYEAKNFIYKFLVQGPEPLIDNKEVLIRFYLASNRTFKNALALNSSFQADIRDLILGMPMPKFIWVAEISDREMIKKRQANGLVILDATEANLYFNKPLILAAYQQKLIKFDDSSGRLENNTLDLKPFTIFAQNLRNI